MKKPKILFVAENITRAQVVRLVMLANGLDPEAIEVHFAASEFEDLVFEGTHFRKWPLDTVAPKEVFAALAAGRWPYGKKLLERYAHAESRLFEEIRPDLVVGDFRLSLTTSVPAFGVPLLTLINAYWSPFAIRERFPIPDHPIIQLVGFDLASKYFPIALPKVLERFAAPMNALRKKYRLSPIGDLREVLTFGDRTLFPDVPELVPTSPELPQTQVYLGPLAWSPTRAPALLESADDRPLIYATLGSSGRIDLAPVVIEALATMPHVRAVVATAGRFDAGKLPSHVVAAPFVDGHSLTQKAAVVVTNGGSSSGWQALLAGRPVVGIPSNLDQFLATEAIVARGAGLEVRGARASVENVREAIERVIREPSFAENARRMSTSLRGMNASAVFSRVLEGLGFPGTRGSMTDSQVEARRLDARHGARAAFSDPRGWAV